MSDPKHTNLNQVSQETSSVLPNRSWKHLCDKALHQLEIRKQQKRFRKLLPTEKNEASEIIDLTHNDYLGLRHSEEHQCRVRELCKSLPVGSGASRLLGGNHSIYSELEEAFNRFKNVESSLYLPSGYAANELVGALLGNFESLHVYSDQLNHASIIDGLKLSGLSGKNKSIFRHNDLSHLESLLAKREEEIAVIWTESIFSMDGDLAPLRELSELASQYHALLIVDEAHALGCFGERGEGLVGALGLDLQNTITINPCGKAIAAAGAFITGPNWLRDYMINFGRQFIYSTAPSPWVALAVHESIKLMPMMSEQRKNLRSISRTLKEALINLGFDLGSSASQICPVLVGQEERALDLEDFLRKHHVLTRAIRPPTVPENQCRLRLSLHSNLNQSQIQQIVEAFSKWKTSVKN